MSIMHEDVNWIHMMLITKQQIELRVIRKAGGWEARVLNRMRKAKSRPGINEYRVIST